MDEPAANSIVVTPNLQNILRDYTKAVLRDRPTDVLTYSRNYFSDMVDSSRMGVYVLPPSDSSVFQTLPMQTQIQIEDLFKKYDTDMSGSISVDELRTMILSVGEFMGFDGEESDVKSLMAILDSDNNKVVSWQEWSHACAEYVASHLAQMS